MQIGLSRCEKFAMYIINKNATIRATASAFSYSKSTVHNDVSKKLKKTNYALFLEVKKILENNFTEKHIRGGIATKNKYKIIKKIKKNN